MSPAWEAVAAWRDALQKADPTPWRGPLSAEGMAAAWTVALEALDDASLQAVAAMEGEPFRTAAMALASTVSTAPLEWCAVLLGRGTALVLKHPHDDPGVTPLLVQKAQRLGLPLTASAERSALSGAELVIAMGDDQSVASIREQHAEARVLAFGHRFSLAWITRLESLPALALDAALHDGRGCMSPVAVASPLPLASVCDALADALAEIERRLPRGQISPMEAASIRTRRALARATGLVREGEAFAVHGLPPERFAPLALPRTLAVLELPSLEALWALLSPWSRWLSTLGTDDERLLAPPSVRVARPGAMQSPPLLRLHDGIDWLRMTLKSVRDSAPAPSSP